VARDVRDALVSVDAAKSRYRVVVSADGALDEAATRALRSAAEGPTP